MTSRNRVTLSTYIYREKDKAHSKQIFEENGNTFMLKVCCKIGAKYKRKILNPLKGSARSAINGFYRWTGQSDFNFSTLVFNFLNLLFNCFFIITFEHISQTML